MHYRTFLSAASAALLLAGAASARTTPLHWETLHVYHTEPTEVFAKLGLTHSTRYGHTLGQKHEPDPSFPPGLTDVVPYDAGHTLLVRGTTAGLEQFRVRVVSADVPDPRWQVSVTLLRSEPDGGGDGGGQALAGQTKTVTADHPVVVAFDTDGQMPQYEITVHLNRDGTLQVTRRTSLSLNAAPPTGAAAVFVPATVWTPPIRQDTRVGDTLSFSDLAADRAAARQPLGQTGVDSDGDYTVQIQITPAPAEAALGAATP